MKRVDLVFRSVGERTADVSLELAIEHIKPNTVYQINDVRPFRLTVEKMLTIEHDADYVVYVDADCLILENIRPFIESIDFSFVDCLVNDYFRGLVRAGVHITRIDLVNAMKENFHSIEKNRRFFLRPESAIRTYAMKKINLNHKINTKILNILHDAHQSYEDIFAKYALREFRDRTDKLSQLGKSMRQWGNSPEFCVARAGVRYAKAYVKSDISDQHLSQFVDELPKIAEKQVRNLNLTDQGPFFFSESEHSKIKEQYSTKRSSKPKVFGIGLSRTEKHSLEKALNILGFDAAPYSKSEQMMSNISNDLFNSSLLDFYDGVVDDAVILHYEKLDRKYKNAKFILTVRETGRWKNSIKFDWNRTDANVPANSRDLSNQLKHHFTLRKKIFDVLTFDEAAVLRAYDDHYHRVIDYFKTRPDDLLVINIYAGEGWDKLCNFLNLPIPDAKFPYAGKREPIS